MKEKIKERTNFGPILIGPFLLNLCHSDTLPGRFVLIGTLQGRFVLPGTWQVRLVSAKVSLALLLKRYKTID